MTSTRPNPVLVEYWRDGHVESRHRGAWVAVRTDGTVVDARGDHQAPIYARSATKSLQALPFIETGAAAAVDATDQEIALAISSHSGEPVHVDIASGLLARVGLSPDALRCGVQVPMHPDLAGDEPRRITNNCSGKHAAFLATARHLGDHPDRYLDPDSAVQRAIRAATADMTGVDPATLGQAVDGCSAPTFRLPLEALALGIGRVANPGGLAIDRADACRRLTDAAAAHPVLVGGSTQRLDTDLLAATDGRWFAKAGAEGVFAVGVVGHDLGVAIKIDDGNKRAYEQIMVDLLGALGGIAPSERSHLASWTDPVRRNWDGLDIGRTVIAADAMPRS